jgi:hypothetical protein
VKGGTAFAPARTASWGAPPPQPGDPPSSGHESDPADPYGRPRAPAAAQPRRGNYGQDALWISNNGEPRLHAEMEDVYPQYRAGPPEPPPAPHYAATQRRSSWGPSPSGARSGMPTAPGRTASPAAGLRPTAAMVSAAAMEAAAAAQHREAKARPRGRANPTPPRKLYVFNNEVKEAEPIIIMVHEHMTLAALKSKIGNALNIKPFGQLYTVDGGLVRDAADLGHCQEVVATKHAGAPFDLDRLPYGMEYTRPAAPADRSIAFS